MKVVPTYVSSSNLDAVGYKYGDLFVRFMGGQVYKYARVPFTAVKAMLEADSIGKYFSQNIRTSFAYEKLPQDPFADAK